MSARRAPECLRTLVSASWTIRKTWASTSGPRSRRRASADASTRTTIFDGLGEAVGVILDRGDQPDTRHDRTAQPEDGLPDIDVDRPGRRRQFRQEATSLVRPAGEQELLDGLRLGVDIAEHLGKAVVHLAGDPFTFRDDGELAQASLETGVLGRDRGLVGERRERLDLVDREARSTTEPTISRPIVSPARWSGASSRAVARSGRTNRKASVPGKRRHGRRRHPARSRP